MARNGLIFAVAGLLFCGVVAPDAGAASNTLFRAGAAYTIDHWDTEDGLPDNEIITIAQTRDGYLWLGTLNGLVRFDGMNFAVFDESNTPGLNSSRLVKV